MEIVYILAILIAFGLGGMCYRFGLKDGQNIKTPRIKKEPAKPKEKPVKISKEEAEEIASKQKALQEWDDFQPKHGYGVFVK